MIWRDLSKRIFQILVTLIFITVPPLNSALAISEEQLEMFAQNNILFYDPSENAVDCTTVNYTTKPTGDQITWIGDSYSYLSKDKIEDKFPGVDIYAKSSKSFAYDIDNNSRASDYKTYNTASDNPSGLTILKSLKDTSNLRKYVVFPLGTNDQFYSTEQFTSFIDEMENIAGNGHTFILITPRTYNATYDNVITAIRNASQTYSNIIIADWEGAVEKDLGKYFSPSVDTIHPNDTGYDLFIETIYNALPGGSVGVVAGDSLKTKVWNWFATANIPGVSDNPAMIAGIMGNLMQESGFNPFAHSSGSQYYGIFQTNAAKMISDVEAAYGNHWGSTNVTEDAVDGALEIELEFLMNVGRYANNQGFERKSWLFDTHINDVENTGGVDGARSYADFFLVAMEGAIGGSSTLEDSKVQTWATEVFGSQAAHWQEADKRRNYAVEIYNELATQSAVTVSTSSGSRSSVEWDDDGYLVVGSMPGITIEDRLDDGTLRKFTNTPDGKPNKILLHNTEGRGIGLAAYGCAACAAHFTIDVKKKEVYQHYSIWRHSTALAENNRSGPIQIEIVGFSSTDQYGYYLPDFTADEWDYLAVLLIAIAEETGIPLTSSVSWDVGPETTDSNGNRRQYYTKASSLRMTTDAFHDYIGVLGHVHAPSPDTHVDPGDIWKDVEAAIKRNPDGSRFVTGGSNECLNTGSMGLKAGGMTLAEAKEFMKIYREITPREWGTGGTLGTEWNIAATNTCTSDLENCVAFTQYFINRYTTIEDITGLPNGGKVVSRLLSNYSDSFTDGGTTPRAYAVFSVASGSTPCNGAPCGHTGIVLGIDTARGKIIIGEAGCSASLEWSDAHEYDLSKYTSGAYTYAYTDQILNLSGQ